MDCGDGFDAVSALEHFAAGKSYDLFPKELNADFQYHVGHVDGRRRRRNEEVGRRRARRRRMGRGGRRRRGGEGGRGTIYSFHPLLFLSGVRCTLRPGPAPRVFLVNLKRILCRF